MDLLVRNEDEAWAALCALEGGFDISTLRFEGWPRLTVSASSGVDAVRESKAIVRIQEVVERHFALLKYGRSDRKRLTDRDSAEVRINVSRTDDGRKLIFDLSAAANAASRIISRRRKNERSGFSEGHDARGESWPTTVREIATKVVEKVNPRDAARLGFAAILVGGLALTSPPMWKDYLAYRLDNRKEELAHQLKMADVERATYSKLDGHQAAIGAKEQSFMNAEMQIENSRLVQWNAAIQKEPLLRFVAASSDFARPALLDIAPFAGSIALNGFEINSSTAKAAVKSPRSGKQVKPSLEGWVTEVHRAPLTS